MCHLDKGILWLWLQIRALRICLGLPPKRAGYLPGKIWVSYRIGISDIPCVPPIFPLTQVTHFWGRCRIRLSEMNAINLQTKIWKRLKFKRPMKVAYICQYNNFLYFTIALIMRFHTFRRWGRHHEVCVGAEVLGKTLLPTQQTESYPSHLSNSFHNRTFEGWKFSTKSVKIATITNLQQNCRKL